MRRTVVLAVLAALGCGKSAAPSASAPSPSVPSVAEPTDVAPASDDAAAPMDAREAAQWAAAKDGEPEELGRLARLVGCEGLRERAETPGLRTTAAKAMQFCPDFSELPWLAQVAVGSSDDDAKAALESIVELAARRRRATDPEDADELHAGCVALLDLARSTERSKERRVLAIRALRMLAERGCVKRADIPTDLDAR